MRRTARVLLTGRVSIPSDGRDALQVTTDYHVAENRAFYLKPDSPVPADGTEITWSDHEASYGDVTVRKLGYSFDSSAPLR